MLAEKRLKKGGEQMNILVCIKPVPDPERYDCIKIDENSKRIVREGLSTIINPSDRNALEEAIRIRDRDGGRITVISMAPGFSRDKLTEALAMGADEAYMISDDVFGGADTYCTSYALSEAIKKIEVSGFDLILAGNESADGGTSHVPAQLAEWLGISHLCRVNRLELMKTEQDEYIFRAWKKTETGRLVFEGRLPCVIAVTSDINKPRLVNAMGIIKAKKKPLTVLSNEQLDIDLKNTGEAGSATRAGRLVTPDIARAAEDLGTDENDVAERILNIIKNAGV